MNESTTTVLVVDDDEQVRAGLVRELGRRRYVVSSAATALAALRLMSTDRPDLVVLDLGLPDLDGVHVLKMIRSIRDVPVIIASGRKDDTEVVRLLRAGADDYLVKPYSVDQLEARIVAVLRRSNREQPVREKAEIYTVGSLVIDPARRSAALNEAPIKLTRREFDLLAYLASRSGEVVSRRELLQQVWRQVDLDEATIDVHVSLLRRKLGETAARPQYLHTVRGVGVRLGLPE